MKREDAQKMCQEIRHYLTSGNPIWNKNDVEEALNMAIDALSEPSGDLISRADAIEALGEEPEIILDTDAEWEMHDRWVDAMTSIKTLPSAEAKTKCIAQIKVDVDEIVERIKEEYDTTDGWIPCSERLPSERQKGEWVEDGCVTKCNICGEVKEFPHWNFCPNCGAYMRGEEE